MTAAGLQEWFTLAELVPHVGSALPGSPRGLAYHAEREGWNRDMRRCRLRPGKGGGMEYHYGVLPSDVAARFMAAQAPVMTQQATARTSAAWRAYEQASETARAKAGDRLVAIRDVEALQGVTRAAAVAQVAALRGIASSALWSWIALVRDVAVPDRLPALLPRHVGRTTTAECDPRAWDWLLADYLRPEQRGLEACYRDMLEVAKAEGWSPIPSCKTLGRRIEREITAVQITIARKGAEAAKRLYPAQRRDRSIFHALQAVNADGHKADVMVKFEDGTIGRPVLTVFQDLHSGMILCCRVDRSENKEIVRLALSDLVGRWGIPELCWLDNGRQFASKWISGGQKTRYRFKIRDEEPDGILKTLGVDVRWTTPYSGQSKPIERAFRDFCENISKHPKFAGAYTGRNTVEKPANYGSRAVPIADFEAVLRTEIERHNARPGRRSMVCGGKLSFRDAYERSLADAGTLIRRATDAQRRMLLLAAEGVTARRPDGAVHLLDTRYWAEELTEHVGAKLTVRFDPQDLAAPIAVYTLDNRLICEAPPVGAVAFDDVDAARDHARARKDFLRGHKLQLASERRLSIDEAAALMPGFESVPDARPKVVRLVANGRPQLAEDSYDEDFGRGVAMLAESVVPFGRRGDDDAR